MTLEPPSKPVKVLLVFGSRDANDEANGTMTLPLATRVHDALEQHNGVADGRFVLSPPVNVDEMHFGDVRSILERERPDIVHAVVHGRKESPDTMAATFKGTGVRVVVIMGMGTAPHAEQIADQAVPVVFGQRRDESSAEAMLAWTSGFYGHLGAISGAIGRDDLINATNNGNAHARRADGVIHGQTMTLHHHLTRLRVAMLDNDEPAVADLLQWQNASVEDNELLLDACSLGLPNMMKMLLADPHVKASAPDTARCKEIADYQAHMQPDRADRYEAVVQVLQDFEQAV